MLKAIQNWLGSGSTPEGDIPVVSGSAGMPEDENSAVSVSLGELISLKA